MSLTCGTRAEGSDRSAETSRKDGVHGMEGWNQKVIDAVPADRLLVWHPKDGWRPICELLDLEGPRRARAERQRHGKLQKNLIMGPAIEAINAWWDDKQGPDGRGHRTAHCDSARLAGAQLSGCG